MTQLLNNPFVLVVTAILTISPELFRDSRCRYYFIGGQRTLFILNLQKQNVAPPNLKPKQSEAATPVLRKKKGRR